MSALTGLEKRLEESEQRLTELIQHLERQQSLEKSLDDARRGLGEASSNLGELATSTKVALESLKIVVDALQETVGILARSNPAETAEAVARIEKELEATREESRKAIGEVTERVSAAQKELEDQIDGGVGEMVSDIGGSLEDIASQQSKSQSTAIRIGYITLIVVLVVLGIETLRFFL